MHHRKQGRQTRASWCSELGAPTVLRKSAPGWGAAVANDNSFLALPPEKLVLSSAMVARAAELLDELNSRSRYGQRWPVFTAERDASGEGGED